jgi:chorismate mutase
MDLKRLDPFRAEIDRIDDQIVRLLNERAEQVVYLAGIKAELGLPVYFPEREDEVLALVQASNRGPLSDEAIRRLFERIIDESRRLERAGGDKLGESEE